MLKKIAVLVSGGGTNLQSLIDACESGDINGRIELVVSNVEDAYALTRARKHDIDAIFEKDNDKILSLFKERSIDLIVLAGYLKIVTSEMVKNYENRIINIHPSLIPAFCGMGYYGKRVHQAAIDRGVKFSGATVHFVDETADTGPIIMQDVVEVKDSDDADALAARVLEIEHKILKESVRLFCLDKILVKNGRVIIND